MVESSSSTITMGSSMGAPFLSKTYEMVDDPSTDTLVSWSSNNSSFIVWNVPEFEKILLPKYFKHNNFSSFVRQLNTYGFRKIDPDRWEFANEGFLRGQRHLLKGINRRKPVHGHTHSQQSSFQNPSVKACVEVGKFGLEEEVDRLKRDKNVLMQELVRLRQQQQSTDNQLQSVGQRVQGMEQRQQQMMSFLAKAMQRPGFLAQIVQKNDGNRQVTGVNKKRRFPNNDEENVGGGSIDGAFSDGQIVKYQPLINEAGKSMLREILKLSEPLHNQSLKDPNAFLLDHIPATSDAMDCGSSSTRTSGVTLSEEPQCSKQTIFPEEKGVSRNYAMNSKTPCHEPNDDIHIPAGDLPQIDAVMSDSSEAPGILSQNSFDLSIYGTHNPDLGFMDVLSAVQNGTMPADGEEYSPGGLPISVDKFWEQFLTINPLSENTEEVDSSTPEASITGELELGPYEGWESHHPVNHLTEQMGLLTAEPERV